ncbi:unnamed protein product, partial [Bubo scandiacus]
MRTSFCKMLCPLSSWLCLPLPWPHLQKRVRPKRGADMGPGKQDGRNSSPTPAGRAGAGAALGPGGAAARPAPLRAAPRRAALCRAVPRRSAPLGSAPLRAAPCRAAGGPSGASTCRPRRPSVPPWRSAGSVAAARRGPPGRGCWWRRRRRRWRWRGRRCPRCCSAARPARRSAWPPAPRPPARPAPSWCGSRAAAAARCAPAWRPSRAASTRRAAPPACAATPTPAPSCPSKPWCRGRAPAPAAATRPSTAPAPSAPQVSSARHRAPRAGGGG